MRGRVPTRMIAVALAAGSLLMVPLAATAGAATPTTCTKATFSPSTTAAGKSTAKSTLGGCNNPALTGGSGVLVATYTTNGTTASGVQGKITWKGTGTSSFTVKSAGGSAAAGAKCHGTGKTKDSLILSTGTITAATSKAAALKGTKFIESLCIHAVVKGKTTTITEYLLPGSKIAI
jgi:hypothetical protein